MPTPATMRVVQMEPGPWPTLTASAPQSARNSTPAALVTLPAMSVSDGNACRTSLTTSPTPEVWPCAVETATASTCSSTRLPTWERIASRSRAPSGVRVGRERRPHDEPELGVPGRLPAGLGLAGDPLDVGRRDQAAEAAVAVDDEHLVDADVGGEELVGRLDRVLRDGGLLLGLQLGARRHHLGDLLCACSAP